MTRKETQSAQTIKAKTQIETKTKKQTKSKMMDFSFFEKSPIIEKHCTAWQSIRWLDLYNLKKYRLEIEKQVEKLTEKKQAYSQFENLVNLINRQIQKNYFLLQTYSQQIFDLYFNMDVLTRYNYELLHYDLLLKNENLNNQLLFYRLTDTKKRYIDASPIITNNEYIKSAVYDKTEKNIIRDITNDIILTEISKNDSVKLEFIKIYQKNLYKYNWQKQAMTISRYKKYIKDKYSYLLSD